MKLPAPIGRPDHASVYQGHRFLPQGYTGFLKPLLTSPSHIVGGAFVFSCFPTRSWRRTGSEQKPQEVRPGLGKQPLTGRLGDRQLRVEASWRPSGSVSRVGPDRRELLQGLGRRGEGAIQRVERTRVVEGWWRLVEHGLVLAEMKREQTGQIWRGLSASTLAPGHHVGQLCVVYCGQGGSLDGSRAGRVVRSEESDSPGGGVEDRMGVSERLGTKDLPMFFFLLSCFFCRAGGHSDPCARNKVDARCAPCVPARACCFGPRPCFRLPRRVWLTWRRGCPDGKTLQEECLGVGIRPA